MKGYAGGGIYREARIAGRGTEGNEGEVDAQGNEGVGEGAGMDSKSRGERPASSNIAWARSRASLHAIERSIPCPGRHSELIMPVSILWTRCDGSEMTSMFGNSLILTLEHILPTPS